VMGALATVLATDSSLEYASNATYILPILISGLVLRGRAVPLFGLFALGAIAFSYMMSNAPWTAADTSTTLTLGVATGLTWLIVHTLEHAAARAREHADATTIANQTLQQQQASLQMTLDEISASNEQMAALLDLVRDLETPTIPLLDGVLVLPLVGHLDTRRASVLTETALKAVHEQRARIVIVDITGVSVVDTAVAQRVERLAQAIQLLGARVILTGIRADVAQTIVTQGLDFSAIEVVGSLQDGVARVLGERVYTSSQAAPRGNSMSRFASVGA
jgi:rsbT co-antagonist protein RsbR